MIVEATSLISLPQMSAHKRSHDVITLDGSVHHQRVVEVDVLKLRDALSVTLVFQNFPVWLLALSPIQVASIYFPGYSSLDHLCSSLRARSLNPEMVSRILGRFQSSKLYFNVDIKQVSQDNVLLVSGTISFLLPYLQTTTRHAIAVYDSHFSNRLRNGRPTGVSIAGLGHISWHRVRHTSVGGATMFCSLFGTNVATLEPQVTALRRTIRHYLDHSERPSPWREHMSTTSVISSGDLLHPSALTTQVKYATSFSHNGWGSRPLNIDELSNIYGLHSRIRIGGLVVDDFNVIVPIALLESMISPMLQLVSQVSDTTDSHKLQPALFPQVLDSPRTWLPDLQLYLSHDWITPDLVTDKAAKRDDADIPVSLWDRRILLIFPHSLRAINWLRQRLLFLRGRALYKEFVCYLRSTYGFSWCQQLQQYRTRHGSGCSQARSSHQQGGIGLSSAVELHLDALAGIDAVSKYICGTWWQWVAGSTLFFWRWGASSRIARDGFSPYIRSTLPNYRRPAKRPKADKIPLIVPKLQLILDRGYVQPGMIRSLTDYFDVPKADDIRLVYNGTSCGLNNALWAPNFWLPTSKTAIRSLDFNYYSVDMDLGDMFLNFPLHHRLQTFSGIDLTPLKRQLGVTTPGPFHVHWTRCWMGAKPSPFCAVSFFYLAEEFIRGNRLDPSNPLRWDKIVLNIPGDPAYNPTKPRLFKWDSLLKCIAGDLIAFVDDLRASGCSIEQAWSIARIAAARLQYLGCQDAARKRRPPTKTPGAWAGSVFKTSADSVCKLVSQEKWDKAKGLVSNLYSQWKRDGDTTVFDYKELERVRGFLVHLAMTYDMFTHHLKGFHLTLASHCGHRDADGWKLGEKDWLHYVQDKIEQNKLGDEEARQLLETPTYDYRSPPKSVKPLPQLIDDLYALSQFLESEHPPEIQDRRNEIRVLLYGFADASGGGLGSSVLIPGTGIRCRTGVWGKDDEATSSNYKEFSNVVMTVEEEANAGTLNGAELFLFTDNSTVEAALYKGNSSNRLLFELIVRLRKVQMACNATILVSHVSGKRMIAQGTDGISRGEKNEGISQGSSMLSFIPLHLSAFERYTPLKNWILHWAGPNVEFLSPADWFGRGHGHDGGYSDKNGFWRVKIRKGIFVWAPPPGAADVALEELRKSLIKRQDSTHIFLCPRLLTFEWRRQLHRTADLVVFLPAGSDGWPEQMHEPLTLAFVFPFLPFSPWQLRGTPKMLNMGRELPKLLSQADVAGRDILREFFFRYHTLSTLSERVVRKMLFFK
jgi:hypothetical protein